MSQKEFQRVKVIENAVGGRLSIREASRLLQLSERQVQRLKRDLPGVASGTPYSYKLLWNFNGIDGYVPYYSPIVGSSWDLYGTTTYGGPDYDCNNRAPGYGLVYELVP